MQITSHDFKSLLLYFEFTWFQDFKDLTGLAHSHLTCYSTWLVIVTRLTWLDAGHDLTWRDFNTALVALSKTVESVKILFLHTMPAVCVTSFWVVGKRLIETNMIQWWNFPSHNDLLVNRRDCEQVSYVKSLLRVQWSLTRMYLELFHLVTIYTVLSTPSQGVSASALFYQLKQNVLQNAISHLLC